MKLKLCSLFSLAIVFAATPLRATTYYWKPGATWGDYVTLSNWSTESISGADASALPGSDDILELNADYALDLGGNDWSLESWGPQKTNAGAEHSLSVRNGSLTLSYIDAAPASITVSNATLTVTGRLGGGNNGSGTDLHQYLTVKDGGVVSVYDLNPCRFLWTIEEGGTLTFNNKYLGAYGNAANVTDPSQNGIWNRGTLNLTPTSNGSASEFSLSGNKGANWCFTLAQQGGTMNLPCPINGTTTTSGRTVYLYVSFSGGTINVTSSTAVQNCKSATLSGSTVWDVVSGATADLTDVTVEAGTSVTKAGSGTLVLKSVPASFAVTNGTASLSATIPSSTALQSVVVRDRGTLTVDVAGASIATLGDVVGTLAIAKPNLTVAAVASSADLSGSVTVDLASFTTGGTVVTTPSAALRAKALAAAQAAISAAGSSLLASDDGSAVVIATAGSIKTFDSTTVTDLADATGWRDGEVPGADEPAAVNGNGVTGTLTAAALAKGWSGITVQNGATLRLAVDPGALPLNFEAGTTLAVADGLTIAPALAAAAPNLVLEPGATLALAEGATCALSGSVTTEATAQKLSRIVVATNATLSVPAGFAFKNVGLVLDGGTLELAAAGEVTFGGASSGETAYFAMAATNATVKLADGVSGNLGPVQFACPASGGTVVVEDVVDLVRVSFPTVYWLYFGWGNPVSAPFRVVADGTPFNFRERFRVQGAATLEVRNGTVRNAGENNDDDRFIVEEEGQIVAGENGSFQHHVASGANTVTRIAGSSETDRPAVVLAGGSFRPWCLYSSMALYIQGGDGHRTLSVSADSFYDLPQVSYWGREDVVFDKLKSVALDAGATLNLRRIDDVSWITTETFFRSAADVPITGAGNVFVTNATPDRPFAVTVQGGANTATGSIAADANSTLLFADGANWAGTVVANGNVVLTNGAEAASVSFGTLQLDGDFPVRAWRSVDAETGRTTYSCDTLAVGAYTGTGALAPVLMNGDDDECFPFGATLDLGTIGADSAIPRLAKHWRAIVVDGEGDARNIKLKFGVGFSVMVR